MEQNSNSVPRRKWAKWSEVSRRVFNETYAAMIYNPKLFLYPAAKKASAEHWDTTAWNAAWTAADAVDAADVKRAAYRHE